jgi:ribosome maturation factor RimP
MGRHTAKTKENDPQRSTSAATAVDNLKRQRMFVDTVIRLAEPLCIAEGLELVHVEYQREPGGLTLRFYLDRAGGVTLDDCVDISRQLEDLLDVHTPDAPPYRLEVSSPGLDRPVGKLKDFIRFEGHRAKIRLAVAINGRKNFTGVLAGVVDETIRLALDKETISIKFSDIVRARLINYNGER